MPAESAAPEKDDSAPWTEGLVASECLRHGDRVLFVEARVGGRVRLRLKHHDDPTPGAIIDTVLTGNDLDRICRMFSDGTVRGLMGLAGFSDKVGWPVVDPD